jgi:hypothetical protein
MESKEFEYGGMKFTFRQVDPSELTEEQRQQQKQLAKERQELHEALATLTPTERAVYDELDALTDRLYDAGVDVSYFPHSANMELVDSAKKLAAKFKDLTGRQEA